MSDENQDQELEVIGQSSGPDELTQLKMRARQMGIQHSPNIGVDALKQKINDRLEGVTTLEQDQQQTVFTPAPVLTKQEQTNLLRQKQRNQHLRLIRCRVVNLNPSKKDLKGEIVTVANKILGTVRKFIPFGDETDVGYHIPSILLEELKTRKFQQIKTATQKGNLGQIIVTRRMVNEYSIEILPQLTETELKELALKQAAAERLGA